MFKILASSGLLYRLLFVHATFAKVEAITKVVIFPVKKTTVNRLKYIFLFVKTFL